MLFGRKRRAEKEAAAKAKSDAELRSSIIGLVGIAEGGNAEVPGWPLMLKAGERLVHALSNGGLFEPRRGPGHWSGRSAGFSVPVADGIRFRIGKSAGTYIQGAEKATIIDTGDISFTTQRVVFQGAKYTREWLFSKLIGITHDASQPCTFIQVSNREKTSGIVYEGRSPELVRLHLAVAVAIFNGEGAEAAQELREKLDDLDAATPPEAARGALPGRSATASSSQEGTSGDNSHPPDAAATAAPLTPAAPPALPPAMWAADPSGRHQLRYWDGAAWTDYVSDDGHEYHESSATGAP
ncbi:MAG TPA: DUF2510 domain-containing protein [Acidimicrobiales bacterium]|nr:DUF2510 domain-containing protein [Acidimicrobiales bacterium]